MPRLVECVPNVSEGRRGDVIDRLADAIRATEGVRLLDRTSDVDHNRSVFTYAGDPDAVVRATHALIDLACVQVLGLLGPFAAELGDGGQLGLIDPDEARRARTAVAATRATKAQAILVPSVLHDKYS